MDVNQAQPYLTVAAAAAILLYGALKGLTPKPIGDIPHNDLIPLVGDFPAILDYVKRGLGVGTWLSEQAFRHGPILSIHMGPFFSKVVIMDPEEVHDILFHRLDEFSFSDTQKAVFGGAMPTGMLSLPGNAMWTTHRKRLAPCMNTQYLKLCATRVNEISSQLGELWELRAEKIPDGMCFDMSDDLQLCTMVSQCLLH